MVKEKAKKSNHVIVSGKRKRAIAKATIKKGAGKVRVNKILVDLVEPEFSKLKLQEAIQLAGPLANSVDINITVTGGGAASQIEAARLVIAKGLVEFTKSDELKKLYLNYDRHLLVADTRRNEPHKPNDSKPRAKRQKSYR